MVSRDLEICFCYPMDLKLLALTESVNLIFKLQYVYVSNSSICASQRSYSLLCELIGLLDCRSNFSHSTGTGIVGKKLVVMQKSIRRAP
jgi:hypothetical protein